MTRFFVHAKGARAEEWKRVFGNDALPVISGAPQRVELPGLGPCDAYMLDVSALSRDSFIRLVNHISQRFLLPASMVESELSTRGMPIPVSDDLIGPALDLRFFV